MSAEVAVSAVALIGGIGIVLNAAEVFHPDPTLEEFFALKVIRLRFSWLQNNALGISTLIQATPFKVLTGIQSMGAFAAPICLYYSVPYAWTLPLIVLLVHLLSCLRFPYSMSGADQMQSIVWVGVLGYASTGSELGHTAALIFIAAQAAFAYVASGYAKLTANIPFWRDGTAVRRVMETKTFGIPALAKTSSIDTFSKLASWSTLAFEILGPFLILFGPAGAFTFVGMAIVFHLSIAVLMGLNRFFFAFGATLPSLYWVSTEFHGWIGL